MKYRDVYVRHAGKIYNRKVLRIFLIQNQNIFNPDRFLSIIFFKNGDR